MKISIDTQARYPFADLESGDVFRYDGCFFMVVDLNPEDFDATDYAAVDLTNGTVAEDITADTAVEYLPNATLKAQKKLLYYPLDKQSRGWYNRLIK